MSIEAGPNYLAHPQTMTIQRFVQLVTQTSFPTRLPTCLPADGLCLRPDTGTQ